MNEPTFTPFVLACRLVREPLFRRYVAHADGRMDVDEVSMQHATNYLHNVCNIESRTQLKTDRDAVGRFGYMLRCYRRWSEQQRQPEHV